MPQNYNIVNVPCENCYMPATREVAGTSDPEMDAQIKEFLSDQHRFYPSILCNKCNQGIKVVRYLIPDWDGTMVLNEQLALVIANKTDVKSIFRVEMEAGKPIVITSVLIASLAGNKI